MKATAILMDAHKLVGGDREGSHGDKTVNHLAIAAIWNGYLLARTHSGKPPSLTALDVANMMEALKIARRLNGRHNDDDYVDGAGYAACAGEIAGMVTGQSVPAAAFPARPAQRSFAGPLPAS